MTRPIFKRVITRDGDVLDDLVWQNYGRSDVLTAVLEHDFNESMSLRSLGRLQKVEQMTNVSALQGTWCLDDATDPFTGGACALLPGGATQPAGTWSPTLPS